MSHFLLELSLHFIITNALNIDFLYNRGGRAQKCAVREFQWEPIPSLKKKTEDEEEEKDYCDISVKNCDYTKLHNSSAKNISIKL